MRHRRRKLYFLVLLILPSVVKLLPRNCDVCPTEQRICLKFCFRLGKTATEAHEMLQKAFKEEALSNTQVVEWFARIKRGEMSVKNHPHSGRSSTSRTDENVKNIREQINEDRRYTIDEI